MIIGRPASLFAGLAVVASVAMLVALTSGSADISPAEVLAALTGGGTTEARDLVLGIRLPRTLTAFAVGGLLAVAGVLMQVLLRNPLAEPYILGSSGGAAVAALLAIILGLGSLLVDLAAFGGALAATLLVFSIAHGTGSWAPARLLLTGVVLAAGFSAITTLLLALSPEENLRGMLFWLMGDLTFAYDPGRVLVVLLVLTALCTLAARHLNVLSRGELQAAIVGMPVANFRHLVFAAARNTAQPCHVFAPAVRPITRQRPGRRLPCDDCQQKRSQPKAKAPTLLPCAAACGQMQS